ncbi:MAG: trigger factor [Candidatus Omnitrophica bacterium]|nr:trigger factor [Candidatus Omnitrophota bacterium]
MKSKVSKVDGTSRELEVEVSKETVDQVLNEAVKNIRKDAVLPGFRKGNAPEDLIFKNYREEAWDKVKETLVPRAYENALTEHKIEPVSYPEITDLKIGLDGKLSFRAKLDIYPEFNLKKYMGFKVEHAREDVSDQEVTDALERILQLNAEFVDTDKPVDVGLFAISDIEAFIDGKSIMKKRENAWIEANEEASVLGIGKHLYGMKKGESKDIDVVLPEDYPDKNFAGKKTLFKVLVKEIKEKHVPAADDALAQKIGKNTILEVRDDITKHLKEIKANNNKTKAKNQIIDELVKQYSFTLPSGMVKRQQDVLLKQKEEELAKKGIEKSKIEENKETLKEQILSAAVNKVRLYFILDKIAQVEKISVTEEDVDEYLKSLAAYYQQSFEEVKKYYEENDLLGGAYEQIKEEKVLDFLAGKAEISIK